MSSETAEKSNLVFSRPGKHTKVVQRSYTDGQLELIEDLRKYARSVTLPASDPYHIWEQRWLNKEDTLPRYMRAAKWKLEDAKKRLHNTLEWRREYKPDLIPPDEVKIESETGKILINGFDNDGRPVIYMRPGRENTAQSPRQLRHLVWCLERAKDMCPPGVDSVSIVVDYKSTTLRTNPSLSTARRVLTILQNHYVETLGRGLVVNLPGILAFFYKGLSPFMDPVTRDKIRFNPDLTELIPAEQLDADFGGEHPYEFEPESYWSQIVEYCGIAPDGTRHDSHPEAPHNFLRNEDTKTESALAPSSSAAEEAINSQFPSESSSETAVQVDDLVLDTQKLKLEGIDEDPLSCAPILNTSA